MVSWSHKQNARERRRDYFSDIFVVFYVIVRVIERSQNNSRRIHKENHKQSKKEKNICDLAKMSSKFWALNSEIQSPPAAPPDGESSFRLFTVQNLRSFFNLDYFLIEMITHHINSIDWTELERLVLRVQYHIDHCAHLGTDDVVRRYEGHRLLQPLLEGLFSSLKAWFNHITGHELQALFEVLSELSVRPMQVANKGLKCVQFPEKIFRCRATISIFC